MRGRHRGGTVVALVAAFALLSGCGGSDPPAASVSLPTSTGESAAPVSANPTEVNPTEVIPLTEEPVRFTIPEPTADGTDVLGNEKAEIDASNKEDGYVMVKYLEQTDKKLIIQIVGPSGTTYQYILNNKGSYDVFPLSDGDGAYKIGVFQNVSGGQYATSCTASLDVTLTDEFAPFIRPNQYVNYDEDSEAVKKAAELTQSAGGVLEKVGAVYSFVIENISYDKEFAQQVAAKTVTGYVPDVDEVLDSGKGICFDYAALTAAMLRSLGIPTQLVIGHAGSVPHAWINVYSEETGWIDDVIHFDEAGWKLMDPTFASSGGQSDEVLQYIGDGSNYTEEYLY